MKTSVKIGLLAAAASMVATPAMADTLAEALQKAYENSATLNGTRAQVRGLDENVPIARSGGLPTVRTNTGVTQNIYNTSNSSAAGDRQATAGVDLNVPIYTGGAVRNGVRAAETRVEGGRATLRGAESSLFTQVVAAYLDVILADAVVQLNDQNVRALQVNLQASKDRFEVGDLTRTDVAQSNARYELARGQLLSAQARLISARETYVRVVGSPPGKLEQPPALPALPDTVDESVRAAVAENPSLEAARKESQATVYDVGVARAQRLPQVGVNTGVNYYNYLGSLGSSAPLVGLRNDGIAVSGGLSLSLPIFQGGLASARIRQAQERRAAATESATDAERQVVAQTRASFANYQAAQEVIVSSQNAVEANKLSLEGVRAENSVGTRTILDILNAEQELLNSQVTLVTARRDAYVAGFSLLAAMGRAEAQDLGLDGGRLYDPTINYKRVRNIIWDYGATPAPGPGASTTKDTPAQTSERLTPLEGDLQRSTITTNDPTTASAPAATPRPRK
jgi:outer membrane protein